MTFANEVHSYHVPYNGTVNKPTKGNVNMIFAHANDYVIGKGDGLPFRVSSDLQFFRKMTDNQVCIVGFNTYKSLPRLPNRKLYVLVYDTNLFEPTLSNPDAKPITMTDAEDILDIIRLEAKLNADPIWIIGGAKVYEHFKDVVDTIYKTHIDVDIDDTENKLVRFDKNILKSFVLSSIVDSRIDHDNVSQSPVAVTFTRWERLNKVSS